MAGFVFAASQNSCAEVCQPDETANPSAQETVQDPPAGTAAQPLTSSEPPLEYGAHGTSARTKLLWTSLSSKSGARPTSHASMVLV